MLTALTSIISKTNYKDGVYDGLVEYYNKDGALKRTETWKDDKMIDEVNH